MSIWQAPAKAHQHHPHIPAHPVTVQDVMIFGGGLIVAMMVGIAASGGLPIG